MKNFMPLLVLAVLAGCAQKRVFTKEGVTPEQYKMDDAACRMEANRINDPEYLDRGTLLEGVSIQKKRKEQFHLCMESKGYK
jgi:hypothetical protein